MHRTLLAGVIAAMALGAAPFALAQDMPTAPPAPPTTQQPAPPTTPGAAPANPANPSVPTRPAPPSASTPAPSPEDGRPACRTRKSEGEQCSCLSAPTTFGTSHPAENGDHNMCVIPEA